MSGGFIRFVSFRVFFVSGFYRAFSSGTRFLVTFVGGSFYYMVVLLVVILSGFMSVCWFVSVFFMQRGVYLGLDSLDVASQKVVQKEQILC